ncbi:MAG TPA: GNAT family N-acetyltransferase, partial [Thermoanaerobaculia bacterium]|nr:GNAT family N-acetyltransferase [Thermoanaerobaculia bacterium]
MRTDRDLSPDPREMGRRRFMLAGEHVILRAFEREDAERCYRWMNDPNIVRTLKSRYPIAFQNEIEWLDRAMHPSMNERHFAIERRDDRTHIGNASIHDIDWVSRT